MKKKILISFALIFALSTGSIAQDFMGYRQSNYSGVSGGDLNPANIADSRFVVDVTIGAVSMSAYNNHIYFNPHLMPYWWTQSFDSTDLAVQNWQSDPNFGKIYPSDQANDTINSVKGNFFEFANPKSAERKGYFESNVDVLNAMITISPTMAISLGVKNRTFLNVDHLSLDLLTLAQNELVYPLLWGLDINDQLVNVSFNSWMEYNLGFAMTVYDEKEHFIKAGAKVKFLQGLGAIYLYTDEMDYRFRNDDTLDGISGHFDYGYSSNIDQHWDASSSAFVGDPTFNDIYSLQSKLGLGLDLGVVYEWRPEWEKYKYDMDGETNLWRRDQNKYKLKVSFALNDIGGMRYEKSVNSRNFNVDISTSDPAAVLSLFDFDDTEGLESFNANVDTLVQSGGATYADDNGSFYMNLPTHMNLGVDYNLWKNIYINTNAMVGFQMNKNAEKVRYPTSISLTPRYDFAWAGLSIPMSYSSMYGARAGVGFRFGPVIFGTSDLRWVFAPGKDKQVRGANVYFALKVPILYSAPKDADLDKVSDKFDLCIDTPGIWEFKGCPDTDGDGIQDSEDSCPLDAGLKEFNGCPDRDGDKIIDKEDACPDDAGLAEFRGCPDRDGDKIIDSKDDCPDEAGIALFNGCPDTDGDGLKDSDDLCPTVAGPIENQGCPDTDNDGIFDYLDECPTEAGPEENRGCPWPDTDGDGILDKDDKCPNNPGPAKNGGCPYIDTDGDGVLDKDDECVNIPGLVENKGCPKIEEEEQEIINTAFANLEFESGKNIIKESSYESLEALADLLIKKGDWKLKIAGHTDSQGAEQANLILSKKRAEAVRDFLVQRGIAPERLIVQYFGEEQPIDTNDTPEGRQRNRRVEMTIVFE
jgi:outer membrane protein OmpA-like peptidoglycan-associated protein